MDERLSQFFVCVGQLCADARMAGIRLEITLRDGRDLVGIPSPPHDVGEGPGGLDETGYADELTIGDVTVPLSDVTHVTIHRPAAG